MRKRLAQDITGLPVPRQRTDRGFSVAVGEVAAFVGKHGRIPDAAAEQPGEAELGAWLEKQRTAHRGGLLSAERAAMLEETLGTGWSSNR